MKLARVTGTVEATVKEAALTGQKLLLCDLVDGSGAVQVPAFVAVDSCGAGVGDTVLLTFNSAARMPAAAASAPVDATIIAIVDRVTMGSTKGAAKPAAAKVSAAKRAAPKKAAKPAGSAKPDGPNKSKPKTSRGK